MKALSLILFCLGIILFNCQKDFKNLGDPNTFIGIIYGVDLNVALDESKPSIVYSEIPISITEGENYTLNFRISEKIKEQKTLIVRSDNPNLKVNETTEITLSFNEDNANIEQQVVLRAESDENVISEKVNLTISSDWFEELSFPITILDNSRQIIVFETQTGSLQEGSNTEATVKLTRQPGENVSVSISSDNEKLLKSNVSTLTFTPENYNIAQSLEIQAVENELYLFDKAATISLSASLSDTVQKEFTVISNNIEYRDLSAGQGYDSGSQLDAKIEQNNLLVTTCDGSNLDRPALFSCNLDGTNCVYKDISVGRGSGSGYYPNINVYNSKLLQVTRDGSNLKKPALFYCNLDGTNCVYKNISAGQGSSSGNYPDTAIDLLNNKLLVVTQNGSNSNRPALFRCDLDGNNCVYKDISAGQGSSSGNEPTIILDYLNLKLLVVTRDASNSTRKLSLFQCEFDGTGCKHSIISDVYLRTPSIIIDEIRSKLLIAATNYDNERKVSLISCELDGTNCTYTDISSGQGYGSGYEPSIIIDKNTSTIHVATRNYFNNDRIGYYRCNQITFECVHKDISLF